MISQVGDVERFSLKSLTNSHFSIGNLNDSKRDVHLKPHQ